MQQTTIAETEPDTGLSVPPQPFPELSKRERQVALLLVQGKDGHAIAAELGVSVKTFDTHRGHVLEKLNLNNTVQLTLLAFKRGYIAP